MNSLWEWLSSESFMPHGYCFLWRPEILWLHVVSDITIVIAYYSIPLTLLYIMRKRRNIPHKWVLGIFSAFIFMCGTTHVFGIWTIWTGVYALAGIVKAMTAAISIASAILILLIAPKIIAAFDHIKLMQEKARPEEE